MRIFAVLLVVFLAAGALKIALSRAQLSEDQAAIETDWQKIDEAMKFRASKLQSQPQTVSSGELAIQIGNWSKQVLSASSREQEITASNQLTAVLRPILEPKAGTKVETVQVRDELIQAENRIAESRTIYNDAVQRYNTDIELFPNNITARLFGFRTDLSYIESEPDQP